MRTYDDNNSSLVIIIIILLMIVGILLYFVMKSKETIIISFNTNYEQKIDKIELSNGDKFSLPILERDNYDFLGWYIGNVKIEKNYKFKKSVTLDAKWQEKKYVLSFDTDGGNEIESLTIKCGLVMLPETPKKSGYDFVEWQDINGNRVDNNSNLTCANHTLKAVWALVKNVYTITFDSDGGTEIPKQSVKEGEKIVIPSDPIKDNYTFREWQLDGVKYNFDNAVTGDITLKAVWDLTGFARTYKVRFISDTICSNGGCIDKPYMTINVVEGKKVTKPANPTKANYTFKEWQLDGKTYDFDKAVTKDIVLKAVWDNSPKKTDSYTITFNAGSTKTLEFKCNEKIANLPKISVSSSLLFIGWFDKNNKRYKNGDIMPCNNLNLYAKYYNVSTQKVVES